MQNITFQNSQIITECKQNCLLYLQKNNPQRFMYNRRHSKGVFTINKLTTISSLLMKKESSQRHSLTIITNQE